LQQSQPGDTRPGIVATLQGMVNPLRPWRGAGDKVTPFLREAGSGERLLGGRSARPCKALEFDFVQPLRPRRRLFNRLGELRGTNPGRGTPRRDRPDLTACEAERLTIRGMLGAQLYKGTLPDPCGDDKVPRADPDVLAPAHARAF
jgi:hypothetical protein